jgi:DNA-directed RNA polymerase subunit F
MNAINEIMEKMKKLNDKLVSTDIKKILKTNENCVKCDMITRFSKIADDILKIKGDSDEYAKKIVDLLFELVFMGEVQKATEHGMKKRKVTLEDLRKEIEKSFMKKTKKYKPKDCNCDICRPKNTYDSEEEDYDYIE